MAYRVKKFRGYRRMLKKLMRVVEDYQPNWLPDGGGRPGWNFWNWTCTLTGFFTPWQGSEGPVFRLAAQD